MKSRYGKLLLLVFVTGSGLFLGVPEVHAQSTFGVVLGDVKDSSGGLVSNAKITLTNTAENSSREATSDANGAYEFRNVKAGPYQISVAFSGFRAFKVSDLRLIARQILRVDVDLQVGEATQTVEVTSSAGVIATDNPAISSSLTPESVLNLPSNVRGAGSTTPYGLLQTLPGVQADNGGGYSIQGGLPAQSESSVDGISITQLTGNSANRNQFLSVESISEIKVQGVGNTAEFGQPGDITVTSKSGGNQVHGALFWYHQNKALDARAFGQNTLPARGGGGGEVKIGLVSGVDHLRDHGRRPASVGVESLARTPRCRQDGCIW